MGRKSSQVNERTPSEFGCNWIDPLNLTYWSIKILQN